MTPRIASKINFSNNKQRVNFGKNKSTHNSRYSRVDIEIQVTTTEAMVDIRNTQPTKRQNKTKDKEIKSW